MTRNIALADGSMIELNAKSSLRVNFSESARTVWLYEGEAIFSVNKDDRPFIVHTPRSNVAALGTEFAIELGDNSAEVSVLEGTVAVTTEASDFPLTEFDAGHHKLGGKDTTILEVGERFLVADHTGGPAGAECMTILPPPGVVMAVDVGEIFARELLPAWRALLAFALNRSTNC